MDAEKGMSGEDTDLKEDEKQANLRAHNVLEMGKFSYEQEEKREQSLITQSGQMLTTFSIASAAVLMALPIMLQYTYYPKHAILWAAVLILFPLVASMVLAVIAQWRFGYQTMVDAGTLLDVIEKNPNEYVYQSHYDFQWIEQLKELQKSKMDVNDLRVKLIKASQICFFVAVGILFFAAIGFLIFL